MTTYNLRHVEPVKAANVTSTGTLVSSQKGRLRGVYVRSGGTAGSAIFKDGGASGTTILTVNTPAQVSAMYQEIPGGGIAFDTDLHVTLSQADGVTAYYAEDA